MFYHLIEESCTVVIRHYTYMGKSNTAPSVALEQRMPSACLVEAQQRPLPFIYTYFFTLKLNSRQTKKKKENVCTHEYIIKMYFFFYSTGVGTWICHISLSKSSVQQHSDWGKRNMTGSLLGMLNTNVLTMNMAIGEESSMRIVTLTVCCYSFTVQSHARRWNHYIP